ncbi:AraC family transcriptional regulator [Paenibacillus beijingensis]|uniref:AraC family transcriptional regulator n=1 Tax=Paenibacillus beijingensis TaxID=1126833 RepID=UPI000A4079DB|nr:AraC family transcriptional regulator [Paenibacillus beijingensis]
MAKNETNPRETYTVFSNPDSAARERLNILFAGESQTAPGHRLGPKVFDYYLLHHVLSGRGTFRCGDNEYELRAGHSFLIEPERLVTYAAHAADPWRYKWVAFTGPGASELVEAAGLSLLRPTADTGRSKRVGVYLERLMRAFRSGGGGTQLLAPGYLHLAFAQFAQLLLAPGSAPAGSRDEGKETVQQVIHYLTTQYAEPLSIEAMADSLGYNRAYLSRLFKKHTGVTPVSFLLRLRIDKGRQLLRERQELTVEQIAASVGLQDPLYFSKQFRRFHGESPSDYREAMRSL